MALRQDSASYIKRHEKVINSDPCITDHTHTRTYTLALSYISRDYVRENERNILHKRSIVYYVLIILYAIDCK